jgi:drug/metabolite transporter (DMT)-like permease
VRRVLDHLYLLGMIATGAYSQIIMRWQVAHAGSLPADAAGKAHFVATLLMNPWIISGVAATFLAGISWMLALTKFEVSYAYPFTSIIYPTVMVAGFLIFNDDLTVGRIYGTIVIMTGVCIVARWG